MDAVSSRQSLKEAVRIKPELKGAARFSFGEPVLVLNFRRFLPLQPPAVKQTPPQHIRQFLVSRDFGMLSLEYQEHALRKIQQCYNGHYSAKDVASHLAALTKLDADALQSFARTYGGSHDVVDWYRLVRAIYRASRSQQTPPPKLQDRNAIARRIQTLFKRWKQRHPSFVPVQTNRKDQSSFDRNPQQNDLLLELRRKFELAPESLKELFKEMDKNGNGEISRDEFDQTLKQLDVKSSKQAADELFRYFDKDDKQFFNYAEFLALLFHAEVLRSRTGYLDNLSLLLQEINFDLREHFPSLKQFELDFKQYYETYKQFNAEVLQGYFERLLRQNKYSRYQLDQVFRFVGSEKFIGKLFTWKAEDMKMVVGSTDEKNVSMKEVKNKQLQALVAIAYSLLDKNDLKDKGYTRKEFVAAVKEVSGEGAANIFFTLFRGLNKFIPYYLNARLGIAPISARIYRENSPKEQRELFEEIMSKYSSDTIYTGKHLGMIIYECFQDRMTDLDYKALGVDLKGEYNMHSIIKKLFEFKSDKVAEEISRALAKKVYSCWKRYKQNKKKSLKLGLDLLSGKVMSILNEPEPDSAKLKLRKMALQKSGDKKSARSTGSERPKSEYEPDAIRLIHSLIDGLSLKPVRPPSKQTATKEFLHSRKLSTFSYRTNLTHFSSCNLIGGVFMSDSVYTFNQGEKKEIRLEGFLRPNNQVLDFLATDEEVVVLRSTLHLDFYDVQATDNFPRNSVRLTNGAALTSTQLDKLHRHRLYNKYPYLLKHQQRTLFVNATASNNRLYRVDPLSGQILSQTKFQPDSYVIDAFQSRILREMKDVLAKRQMTPTKIIQLNQFPMPKKAFKHLLAINFHNLQKYVDERKALFDLLEITGDEVSVLQGYYLRTLLTEGQTVRQLPQKFQQAHEMLHDYLLDSNMSLLDLLYDLDDANLGHITYKSFKNLLQRLLDGQQYDNIEQLLAYIDSSGKIHYDSMCQFLQAVYSAQLHEDEIKRDFIRLVQKSAEKHLTIEKCRQLFFPVFQYSPENIGHFLETLTYTRAGQLDMEWFQEYSRLPEQTIPKLWQRPKCPIEDFAYIEDYRLLVHTVSGHNCIFVGEDVQGTNRNLCVLTGQQSDLPPIFHYIKQAMVLVSGDRHTGRASNLYIWNLQSLLVRGHRLNPPWVVTPTKVVQDLHSDSISCISFASCSGVLITASTDSIIKCWKLDTNKQELEEIRRVYQNDTICIGCEVVEKTLEKNYPLQKLLCLSVEKMVNKGNRNQIAVNAEQYCLEMIKMEVAEDCLQEEIPLKLRNQLEALGNTILQNKQKAAKIRSYELQKEASVTRRIRKGFMKQFLKCLKRYVIFGEDEPMQKVFGWMRQLYGGISLAHFKTILKQFGLKVELTAAELAHIQSQLSFARESQIDLGTIKNDLPLSLLFPTITAEMKQKIKRELDRLQKDGLAESEFYNIFAKAKVGTEEDLRSFFDMALTKGSQGAQSRVLPLDVIYKSILRENPKAQTPAAALRKLCRHLRKYSIEPWRLFCQNREKLAFYLYQPTDQFKEKLTKIKALSDNEIQLILTFFDSPKGISLKRFIDCLIKASYFIEIASSMGSTVNLRQGSVERRSTVHAGSLSPRELDVSEYRSVFIQEDQNASQFGDMDPRSVPVDDGGMTSSKHIDGVPLTFKGKNFNILSLPNLTRLRQQLSNDPIKLKELLKRCEKAATQKRIQQGKFRQLLAEDHSEDQLQQICKEISDFYGAGPIDYQTVLPQLRSDSDLQVLCCQLYECLRHNTLNISQKEYLKMFKIEQMNKNKVRHLLKKLKLTVTIDMQQVLVRYLNCVRAISIEQFLRKIHPKQYPKPNIKGATAEILLQEKEQIMEIIVQSIEQATDFNVLQHVPFSLIKNTLINPKYQISNTEVSALEDYLKKLRKEEYKFIPSYKEAELHVNMQLMFDQLANFVNPNAENHSMSSSSLSMSKESIKDLRRKSDKNIGQSQASSTSELSNRINDIVHRGQAKLKQKGKSIWQVLTAVQPDWMEGQRITKQQFFRVFDSIDPGLRLREKVQLLRYCDRQKSGQVDIEMLLQAFENKHLLSVVDRFILSKVSQIMQLRELKLNKMIADMVGQDKLAKEKITPYEVSQKFGEQPFFFPSYVLKQLFRMLSFNKKLFDDEQEVCDAFSAAFKRCGIELSQNTSDLVRQLSTYLDVEGVGLQTLLPISSTGKINLPYLVKHLAVLQPNHDQVQQLWRLLIDKLNLQKKLTDKKMMTYLMQHTDLLKLLKDLVQHQQFSKTRETSLAKRIVKAVEHRQLSLFEFFLLVDKARKGSVSELEFNNGLRELGVLDSVWRNIPKKNSKWLTFGEFVRFLIRHEACDISIADTDLQVAMSLFIRRVLGKERIDRIFQKLSQLNGQAQQHATWQSFHQYVQTIRVLKLQQEQLIFSALVHADELSRTKLGNDAMLKQQNNLKLGFSYRQLIRLYYHFTRKNIKKTAVFKLQEALLKRRVSLFQEMMNFMQTNRKVKEIGELLKNKQLALSRTYMVQFLTELNTGLSDKDIKECVLLFDQKVSYNDLQSRLQKVYESASDDAGQHQTLLNARRIFDCINALGSSSERLFQDFDSSHKNCMRLADFNEMCGFVSCGLNKIQIKQIFELADQTKKGNISVYELNSLFEECLKVGDKPEEKIELEQIVSRVMASRTKLKLPEPVTLITDQVFVRCFEGVLNPLEVSKFLGELRKKHGKFLDGQKLLDYIEQQVQQSESKTHRKARSIIKRLLAFFSDYALTVKDWYRYFTQGNFISKAEFFTLMQTLPFKLEMDEIDDLFGYLDEARTETLTLEGLSYKIDVAVLSSQGTSNQQSTKMYYKTKQKLQEIYMHFVRKLFRDKQIHSFFDTNGTGELTGKQLIGILQDMDIALADNQKNKLIKYLSKDQQGTISVNNLLRELKSCLPNQTKEVLETKTFQIFKQHQDAIQQQPDLFIDRLLDGQIEVRYTDNKSRQVVSKGIRQKDLFNVLKDFGVLLTEEQLQDVRANFGVGHGHEQLDLEKVYALIDSVLSGTTKHEKSLQVARYNKLLRYFKSRNITFRQVEEIVSQHGSARGLTQILQSLHILRPIEVKRLVDPLVVPGTTQVDLQLFKENLLSSYYGEYKERMTTQQADLPETALLSRLKDQLFKQNSNSNFWMNQLNSKSCLLSKQSFEQTLVNSGVILSKKDINAVLRELSDEKGKIDRMKVSVLVGRTDTKSDLKQIKQIEEVNENEHHDRIHELLDHVSVSINYKEASLLECVREVGCNLEGQCPIEYFMEFLRKTGYDSPISDVQQVLALSGLPTDRVQINRFQKLMLEEGFKLNHISEFSSYRWISASFKATADDIEHHKIDIAKHAKAYCDRQEMISWQQAYKLLKKSSPNGEHVKILVHFLFEGDRMPLTEFLDELQYLLKMAKDKEIPNDNPKLHINECCHILEKFNPVRNTESAIAKLTQKTDELLGGAGHAVRGMKLLANTLLSLRILQTLQTQQVIPMPIQPLHPPSPLNFFPIGQYLQKPLLLEEVRPHDELSYIINESYLGFKDLKLCEDRLKVQMILRSNSTLYEAENFYCVPMHTHAVHCSGAINMNWQAIAQFGRTLLLQIHNVHRHGYCLANLRWKHLSQQKNGLVSSDYPCRIDNMGRLAGLPTIQYSPEDPYVSPEYLHSQQLDFKVDTWSFGCMMVRFIFGQDPSSIHLQLGSGVNELPSEFSYIWLSDSHLKEILCFEHENTINSSIDELFLLKPKRISELIARVIQSFRRLYSHVPEAELELSLKYLKEMLVVVDACLNFSPNNRPTVGELLAMPIFQENKNVRLGEVLEGLAKLASVRTLVREFEELKHKQELLRIGKGVKRQLSLLEKQSNFLTGVFQKYRGVYLPESALLLSFKRQSTLPEAAQTKIQSYRLAGLNVQNGFINYIFNTGLLRKMVIDVNLVSQKDEMERLLTLLTQLSEQLKKYGSALVYFSVEFLYVLLMACFGQLTDFLSQAKQPEQLLAALDDIKIRFSYEQRKPFIDLYKRIIGSNGQPAIEYLPIYEAITAEAQLQEYFHSMYVVLALYCGLERDVLQPAGREQAMARVDFLSYTIGSERTGQFRAMLDGKCPALMITILQSRDYKLGEKALQFFLKLSSTPAEIFKRRALYTPLFGRLRAGDEPLVNKSLAIQTLINLLDLDDREVIGNLSDGSLEEVLKLSIEPTADSPERSIYNSLKGLLEEVAVRLRNQDNQNCARAVASIPGSFSILYG